eukprot:3404-Prymnesium_polylepis.3
MISDYCVLQSGKAVLDLKRGASTSHRIVEGPTACELGSGGGIPGKGARRNPYAAPVHYELSD